MTERKESSHPLGDGPQRRHQQIAGSSGSTPQPLLRAPGVPLGMPSIMRRDPHARAPIPECLEWPDACAGQRSGLWPAARRGLDSGDRGLISWSLVRSGRRGCPLNRTGATGVAPWSAALFHR